MKKPEYVWITHPFLGRKIDQTYKETIDYLSLMWDEGFEIIGMVNSDKWLYKKRDIKK